MKTELEVTERRPRKVTRTANSFIKWAGAKGGISREIVRRFPARLEGTYYEPFVGSGAVFLAYAPARAVLGDANAELMNCFRVVRDDTDALVEALDRHPNTEKHYLSVRALDPDSLPEVERAARTIFLNKTGFKGLFRVNSRGQFNVPYGWNANANVCDEPMLRRVRAALAGRHVELRTGDYEETLSGVGPGDVVYLDPPYAPETRRSFVRYQAQEFDQHRLARVFADLDRRGAVVLASNADVPLVRSLYRDFQVEVVATRRQVARNARERSGWTEVLISNARAATAGNRRPEPGSTAALRPVEEDDLELARAVHDILFGYGWLSHTQAVEAVRLGLREAGWMPTPQRINHAIRSAVDHGLVERGLGRRTRAIRRDPLAFEAADWNLCLEMVMGEDAVERGALVRAALDWGREILGLETADATVEGHAQRALSEALAAALQRRELEALDLWRVRRAPPR